MERFVSVGSTVGVAGVSWQQTVVISTLGSVGTFIIGAWNMPLQLLLLAMCLDYLSGTLKALYLGKEVPQKGINSKVGFKGLLKKVSIILIVSVAQIADGVLGLDFIRNATCIAYTINEAFSICENVANMGVWVPPFIKDRLAQANEQIGVVDEQTDKNIDIKK